MQLWLYPLSIGCGGKSDLGWGGRDKKPDQVEGTCHRLAGKLKVKDSEKKSESDLGQARIPTSSNALATDSMAKRIKVKES